MVKDRYERRHRRTWRNPNCVAVMANANFDAVPSLADALGLTGDDMKPVTITHKAVGESRDGKETIELEPGAQGRYRGHVPLGMVVLEIDGREWIVHPAATDIR